MLNFNSWRRLPALVLVGLSLCGGAGAQTSTVETVVLPRSVPDPLEPFNRVMWGFNKAFMTGVVRPLLVRGANVGTKNKHGETALRIAEENNGANINNHVINTGAVIALLKQAGAK